MRYRLFSLEDNFQKSVLLPVLFLVLNHCLPAFGQCENKGELTKHYCQAAVAARCAAKMTACEEKRKYLLQLAAHNQCLGDNISNQDACKSLLPRTSVTPSCPEDLQKYPTTEAAQKVLHACLAENGIVLPGTTPSVNSSSDQSQEGSLPVPNLTGNNQPSSPNYLENQTTLGTLGHLMMSGNSELQSETENFALEAQSTFLQSGSDAVTSQLAGDAVRLIGGFSSVFKKKRKEKTTSPPITSEKKHVTESPAAPATPQANHEPVQATPEPEEESITPPVPSPQRVIKTPTQDPMAASTPAPVVAAPQDQVITPSNIAPAHLMPKAFEYDLIVKIKPEELLPGTIIYETDAIINYRSLSGNSASINKKNVAAVLYRDGQTQILTDPDQAGSALDRLLPETEKYAKSTVERVAPSRSSLASPAFVTSSSVSPLSDSQYQAYRKQALNKLDEFVQLLNIISDKTLSPADKDQAIEQAQKLFLPEATIAVSSSVRPGARQFKVKDYLIRLKLLPYSSTQIEWNEVSYVKELTLSDDGNYYGMISGQQTFKGYGANGKNLLYSDITQKNVRVKLQSYQKSVDGQSRQNWEVLLGNIGISVNQ